MAWDKPRVLYGSVQTSLLWAGGLRQYRSVYTPIEVVKGDPGYVLYECTIEYIKPYEDAVLEPQGEVFI